MPEPAASDDKLFDTAMVLIGRLQKGKASRKTVIALIVSIVLDVALTAVLGIVAVNQEHTTTSIHRSQLAACATGNAIRNENRQLWEFFLAVATSQKPAQPPTPAQKAQTAKVIAELRAQIRKTYAPVN